MTNVKHTAELTAGEQSRSRALMDLAFNSFSDVDWDHALGGTHVLVDDGEEVLAHGSLVMRRLLSGDRTLRCGYVEAVAVHPDHQRRGLGSAVMAALERLGPAYDVLALSSSTAGRPLYEGRGWTPWRGPTSVLTPTGIERTARDDGAVYVLGGHDLDLDGVLACDWRDGEVW